MRSSRITVIFGLALAALAASTESAHAAWPLGPTVNVPVTAVPNRAFGPPEAAPDSCGGIIVAWSSGGGSIMQINVQRIDALGQPRWALNGFPISPPLAQPGSYGIASDGAGGAYVTWATQVTATLGSDVFVQHVLSAGLVDPVWPAGGLTLCSQLGDQVGPHIVPDGAGGAVIAWTDARANPDIASDVFAQRVSPTGGIGWVLDGAPVVAAPGGQFLSEIAPDGSGGIFAVWHDPSGVIAAQRLDGPTGTPQWAAAGLPIASTGTGTVQMAIASEPGRLFLAWSELRNGPAVDIYAQAVTLGGSKLWGANGAPVITAALNHQFHPRIVADGLGGAIVGWEDNGSGNFYGDRVLVQRLGASGNPLWAPNGLPVCVSSMDDLKVVSDQHNGAIFTWADWRNGSPGTGNSDIFAQRVSDTGLMLWAPHGVAISTAPGLQISNQIVSDGAGGAVIAWKDYRAGGIFLGDIYAQQVGAPGLLGVRAPSKNCAPDICGFAYTDFADAPENAPVYPSGSFGHFPTCTADSPPGTQELACGVAPSTPPGLTGFVQHVATPDDSRYFGLGCGPANAQQLAVDTEVDGVVHVAGGLPAVIPSEASICSPAVTIMTYESAFGGLWFGTDETAGDGIDAGIAGAVAMAACDQVFLPFTAWSCGPANATATLNILVDWNQDGDWNDVVSCGPAGSGSACIPEWAVKNASIVLHPGCNSLVSPLLRVGGSTGGAWMRVTLTAVPVPEDFPWAGSVNSGIPGGTFAGGETEDYPISIIASTAVGPAPASDQVLLAAISPNPMRTATEVHYSLPQAAELRLVVYDLVGRQVRRLASGWQEAGAHSTRWDGRDDAGAESTSGLYFMKLRVQGREFTRTVVRMR